MKKFSLVALLLASILLVVLLLSACGGTAPTPAPAPAPAPTPSAIDVSELYATNCATCHGENRQGISGLGDALIPEHLEDDSDAEIRDTILNGLSGTAMPGFKDRLSPEEIDTLLQFIKYTSP